MKKLIILTLILAAGLTAYPQSSSRSSRQSKSKAKSSVSRSKSSGNRSSHTAQSRSKNHNNQTSQAKRASSRSQSKSQSVKSGSSQRSRSQSSVNRNVGGREKSAVRSSSSSRSSARKPNAVSRSGNNRSSRTSKASSSSSSSSSSSDRNISSSSARRVNRSMNNTYERNDGRKFSHDNNKVFASRRYRVDYRSTSDLRNSNDFRRVYNDYNRWSNNRYRRNIVVRNYNYNYYAPLSLDIRRVRYPYRRPVHIDLCWTPWLHQRFIYYYPMHNNWNIGYGNYIESISSYDAMHYAGSVKRVYGKVEEVYYSPEDRTYTLYFGASFPYHDFSVVIPKRIAKEISWSPSWHFDNEYVWVIGLIDVWEDKAEIIIQDEDQIRRY